MSVELFELPPGGPYLLSHSVGCLPRAARNRLEETLFAPWAAGGGEAWDAWLATLEQFRGGLARLLGGHADEYCPQTNLSSALTKLLMALPAEPGRRVLLAAEASFPSLGFVLGQMARLGYETRWLPASADLGDADVWAAALDEQVAAVLVMHVHSNSGVVSPVAEIAARAREVGAFSVIDVAQSAGVLPIDVAGWGADAVIGSCVKWLCGGPGAGFLWVARERAGMLAPLDVGWFSHATPFAFDIHDFRYAPDARRFWGGTPSVAGYAIATAGLDTLASISVGRVFAHNRRLIAALRDSVPAVWRGRLDPTGRGGTLCLPLRPEEEKLVERLRTAGCRFDRRGDTLRLSLHIYNDLNDVAAVAACFG